MKYWATYDLDGSFDFIKDEEGIDLIETHGHLIGPFSSLAKAKISVIGAFKHCIMELNQGILEAKHYKEPAK